MIGFLLCNLLEFSPCHQQDGTVLSSTYTHTCSQGSSRTQSWRVNALHECTAALQTNILDTVSYPPNMHSSYWKHLPPFFGNAAYLCPSVIPLLLWLLLFIVSHAISALHLAFAFEHLLCVLPQSLASVSVHVCICLIFTSVSVCDFFFPVRFCKRCPSADCARQRSKQGRCTYLRREHGSLPRGQMTAECFCHLLIYSVVFSSNSPTSDSPIPPLHDLNPFPHPSYLLLHCYPVSFLVMKT